MNENKCSVKGCNRPVRIEKHQLCNTHVQRYYRKGNPGVARIAIKRKHESFQGKVKCTTTI